MTVLEVLKLATDHFQKHGSDSARLDAEVLLAHALGLRRLDLYLKFDRTLSEPELSNYRALTAKRAKPIAGMTVFASIGSLTAPPSAAPG